VGGEGLKTPVLAMATLSPAWAVLSGAVMMARRSLLPNIQ
jgi:hypothetical protein